VLRKYGRILAPTSGFGFRASEFGISSLNLTQMNPIQIHLQSHNGPQPSAQEIAVRAYQVWEAAGRPAGRAVEHWLAAEALLRDATAARPAGPRLPSNRYGLVLNATMPASMPQ
jgi:hypothetical protein